MCLDWKALATFLSETVKLCLVTRQTFQDILNDLIEVPSFLEELTTTQHFFPLNCVVGILLHKLFNRVFQRVADVVPAQFKQDYLNNPFELVLVL